MTLPIPQTSLASIPVSDPLPQKEMNGYRPEARTRAIMETLAAQERYLADYARPLHPAYDRPHHVDPPVLRPFLTGLPS